MGIIHLCVWVLCKGVPLKTRNEIIADNPIEQVCESRGIKLRGQGAEKIAKCPFHQDKSPSLGVNVKTGLWTCYAGCGGGSVIDLIAKLDGKTPADVLRALGDSEKAEGWKPAPSSKSGTTGQETTKATPSGEAVKPKLVKTYDYRNAKGDLVYQACRLEPKSFRQRRPAPNSTPEKPLWFWNMEGVERVLYQLPKVLKTVKPIFICEGEKDCDTVTELGFVGTCNVGGAGKWLDAYADVLAGKEIVLCGDNDKPGKEHMDTVLESLAGKAKSVRVVSVPSPHKDVTDWLGSLNANSIDPRDGRTDAEVRFDALSKAMEEAPLFDKGINLPLYTIAELRQQYLKSIAQAENKSLDLGRWLPALGRSVRPLIAGEVLAILGGTGTGKTALAQNIALHARPLKTLFFEQELPGSLTLERFTALAAREESHTVYSRYRQGDRSLDKVTDDCFDHVITCNLSKLTVEQIESHIQRSALKFGEPPALVILDYIQLMGGKGERRNRVADAAEGLKALAKNQNVVVIILSQIGRKPKDATSNEVSLEDGKEAGEIENSAGVVLGAWRDEEDETLLTLKVLKNTKGLPGKKIECNFDGARLLVTERAVVSEDDVPKRHERTVSTPYKDND